MIEIRGRLRKLRINVNRYRNELDSQMIENLQTAAHKWLNASLDSIPVWSGASHSTFLRLASLVQFPISIHPAIGFNRFGLGRRHGVGKLTQNKERGEYTFLYETTLPHLIHNEFNNANAVPDPALFSRLKNPGPYQFQERAQQAFEDEASKVRSPNPFRFLDIKETIL